MLDDADDNDDDYDGDNDRQLKTFFIVKFMTIIIYSIDDYDSIILSHNN